MALSPSNCVLTNNARMSPTACVTLSTACCTHQNTVCFQGGALHDLLRGVSAQSGMASVTAQRGQCLCCVHAVVMARHVTKNAAMHPSNTFLVKQYSKQAGRSILWGCSIRCKATPKSGSSACMPVSLSLDRGLLHFASLHQTCIAMPQSE